MRVRPFFEKALHFLRSVVVVDLCIILVVAVSFLFTGKFTFVAFSERMFWAGMILTLIAGVVGVAAGLAGSNFGIPVFITRPEHAKKLVDNMSDYRAAVENRYDVAIQLFIMGLGCIAISALVQSIWG
jgi:hypothetical protein